MSDKNQCIVCNCSSCSRNSPSPPTAEKDGSQIDVPMSTVVITPVNPWTTTVCGARDTNQQQEQLSNHLLLGSGNLILQEEEEELRWLSCGVGTQKGM